MPGPKLGAIHWSAHSVPTMVPVPQEGKGCVMSSILQKGKVRLPGGKWIHKVTHCKATEPGFESNLLDVKASAPQWFVTHLGCLRQGSG